MALCGCRSYRSSKTRDMDWLSQFASQPVTQIGGLFGILVALQRAGIIDLKAAVQRFFNTADVRGEVDFDNRTVLQSLLLQMEKLSEHYNHDTTDQNDRIIGKLDTIINKHEESHRLLGEMKEYGVKCRQED